MEDKYQIVFEAVKAERNGEVGEVLRRHGIHSSDLQRIKRTVEEGKEEPLTRRYGMPKRKCR